ncbi:ANTAR domain-containing protein [Actinomadura gamaensis]|uniref:ANTAR domain-containing protein n=1 Tax=Actinomadura gamaensis TaxID=1763541 RepID=A0ABV9U1Z4_9ACTN
MADVKPSRRATTFGGAPISSVFKERERAEAFHATDAPLLVVDTDLVIRDVNPAYLHATFRSYDELVGTPLFEAFPRNPNDPTSADAVADLTASFERVFRSGGRDHLPLQRYDIPSGDIFAGNAATTYVRKVWLPVNTALHDETGRVVGALHHARDVTPVADAVHAFGTSSAEAGGDERAWASLIMALAHETHGHQEARTTIGQLQSALNSRIIIEQAKGVIASRAGVTMDEAFARLRHYSRSHNLRIHDVAHDVVEKGLPV